MMETDYQPYTYTDAPRMTRREFLNKLKVIGAGVGTGLAINQIFSPGEFLSWLLSNPMPDTPCIGDSNAETLNSRIYQFSGGEHTKFMEPAVMIANGYLIVSANRALISETGDEDLQGLNTPVWAVNLQTGDIKGSIVDLPDGKINSYGSDSVLSYLPDKKIAVLISMLTGDKQVEEDANVHLKRVTQLVASKFDMNKLTWSHEKIDLPDNSSPDKPWFYWNQKTQTGYLTFNDNGKINVYTCKEDLKFKHLVTPNLTDAPIHVFPFAFPYGEGKVDIIYATAASDKAKSLKLKHIVYDPKQKTFSTAADLFDQIYPNPLVNREEHNQMDKNISATVTPDGLLVVTSGTRSEILVACRPIDKMDWKTYKFAPKDQRTNVAVRNPISINPQYIGPNRVGISFLGTDLGEKTYKSYMLPLKRDANNNLSAQSENDPAFHGPFPCEAFPNTQEMGDYSQIMIGPDTDQIAFAGLVNNKLQVRVMTQAQ